MKGIILLLALIGSVCSLQYPVEYHYRYEGRAETGIPSIRAQVAAVGIKARLILQMKTKSQGLAKLTDVEVGDFNGDLQCVQMRQPAPIHFKPNQQLQQQLQQPFAVSFQEDMGHVMDVPQSDVEYITNIRKSIVEMLRLEPVVANLGGIKGDSLAKFVSGGRAPDVFTVDEETIFGRCQSQYTISREPAGQQSREKQEMKKHLKQDDQSRDSPRNSGQGVPKLAEQYYRLVRAVNFDKCQDLVIIQHAGAANMSTAGNGQFQSAQSRSSVSSYILKGQPGAFRVERAVVEGDVIANPFGFKTQRLQTITNQTLTLESAQAIHTQMRLPNPTKSVKTWRFEVASPFRPPQGHPQPWINYQGKGDKYSPLSVQSLLGTPLTPSQIQQYKSNLLQTLASAASKLSSQPEAPSSPSPSRQCTKSSIATTQLQAIAQMMHSLPLQTIREIFQQVSQQSDEQGQRKQMLLADAAAASGAAAPIKVLLEQMKNQKISHQRSGSIFMTMPNNLMAPSVIPDIMEYVKSLDMQKNPILASSALINFASLAERLCLNQKKQNYSAPNQIYGDEACNPSQITNDFLPFLKQKAQSASKSWERAVCLQAIANLGTPQGLPALRPYIFGHIDANPRVRAVAIYGLTRRRLPQAAKQQVFDTLMEVIYNTEDKTEVRQAAFSTLVTWQPGTAWWQQMARQTWREPSQSMAAYITFTIQSLAQSTEPHLTQQARIAAFVLPLLKPYSPSTQYSFNYIYSRYDPIQKVGLKADFTSIQSPHEAFPSELYSALQENFGDVHLDLFEVSFASEGLSDILAKALSQLQNSGSQRGRSAHWSPKDPAKRKWQEMASQTLKKLGDLKQYQEHQEANIYIRAFENMYQYLPLNSDVISKVAGAGASDFLSQLTRGTQTRATKYANPISIQYFMPTEIGLPLVGSVAMPSVSVADTQAQLQVAGQQQPTIHSLIQARNAKLQFSTNAKFLSKLIVKMQVVIPWENKVAESGVENYKEINLPAQGTLSLTHTQEIKSLAVQVSPRAQQQFPIALGHNIPYTEIRSADPSQELQNSNYKIIASEKDRQPVEKIQAQVGEQLSGFSLQVNYEADVPNPFTASFATQEAQTPARSGELLSFPTAKQAQYSLTLSPNADQSKQATIEVAYITPVPQNGERGSDQMPDLSPQDSDAQRVSKLRGFSQGSQVYALSAQASFEGSQSRKYVAVAAITSQQGLQQEQQQEQQQRQQQRQEQGQKQRQQQGDQQQKQYKALLALLADPIPGYTDSPNAICAQAEYSTPDITSFESLKQAMQSQPQESVRAQVNHGSSCRSPQMASISGQMSVSADRQSQIQDELQKICNFDPRNPVAELQTAAVYDQAELQATFSQERIPSSLASLAFSIQKMSEGYLFPKGSFKNNRDASAGSLKIQAQRPVASKGYNVQADIPSQSASFNQVNIPYCLTRIVPWTGLQTTFSKSSRLLISTRSQSTCSIRGNDITTFDGLKYQYSPLQCWTTAAIDAQQREDFIVHTRKSQSAGFEVQVLMPNDNAEVVASETQASINGQPMPSSEQSHVVITPSGKDIMQVIRHKESFEIVVIGKLSVVVQSQQIDIRPDSSQRGQFRGVCGDFDGEQQYDQTGPKDCLYTGEDELFKFSWTIPEGAGCDTSEVNKMEQQVQSFQTNCNHRPTSRTTSEMKSIYESKLANCYQHVYPVQKDGPAWCAAEQAVQICTKQCRMHDRKQIREIAKCWLAKNVPQDVKNAESRGYLPHPAREPAKFRDYIQTWSATDCRPN